MLRAVLLLLCLIPFVPCAGAEGTGRESIAFILGEDAPGAAPMYRLATGFFRTDPLERSDQVITEVRSLRGVRDHLLAHAPANGQPWGVIDLVVHGSAEGLLDLPPAPGADLTTRKTLRDALATGALPPLPPAVADPLTEIRVHSCSLGKAPDFLGLLSQAFGGAPKVRASRYYTAFEEPSPGCFTRFLCDSWDLALDRGPRPAAGILAERFRRKHPGAGIDAGALERGASRWPGDTFSYELPVTFTWTVVYAEAEQVPFLFSQRLFEVWLRNQAPLVLRLNSLGFGVEQMGWTRLRTTHPEGGLELPALKIMGEGRRVLVLRGLTGSGPLDWKDGRYYVTMPSA
jgi:hypothetical protein